MRDILMWQRPFIALTVICAFIFNAAEARAAVEAQGVLAQNANPELARFLTTAGGNFSVPYTVQSSATQVLVVGLYFDAFPGGQQSTPVNSLQFAGVAAADQINRARATLAYFSVLPGTGTFNITGDTGLSSGVIANGYVWELSDIDLGDTPNSAGTGDLRATETMLEIDTSADRLITNFLGANKQTGTVAPQPGSVADTWDALHFGVVDQGGTVAGGTDYASSSGINQLGWMNVTGPVSAPWGELAYAFARQSSGLVLNVNTFTGEVEIVNPSEKVVSIDYYKITSAGRALSPETWNSLDAQNEDAVGPNEGQSWDINPSFSDKEVNELYLDGQAGIAADGGMRTLGKLFNPEVFGKRADGDLVFECGVVGQSTLKTGVINYITPAALLGDYNDDGEVNAADYTVYRNRKAGIGGTTLIAINEGATPGTVTVEDYQVWKDHYGETLALGSGSSVVEAQNVPEPASLALAVLGGFTACRLWTRRRRER